MSLTFRTQFRELLSAIGTPASTDDVGGAQTLVHPALDVLWPNGTSDNQADRFWCDYARTVASATNDDLDLRALANGPGGATIVMAEVRAILLFWNTENTTDATLQPGASNGWTGLGATFLATIKAGTYWRLIAGKNGNYPTTASDKVLRIANSSGATATYSIAVIGCSA